MNHRTCSLLLATLAFATAASAQSTAPQVDSSTVSADAPGAVEARNLSIPQLVDEARAALDSGNALLAKSLAQTVLLRDEKNIDAMLIDAEVALLENDHDRARVHYRTVLSVRPADFTANLELGRLYWRSKVFRQATWYFEKARDVAPRDQLAEVLTLLSRSYRGSGYAGRALETVIAAIRADRTSLEAWEWLVKLRTEAEDYDQALIESGELVRLARQAAINNPTNRQAIEQLYGAYSVQHNVLWAKQRTYFQPMPDGSLSEALLPGAEKAAAENLRRIVDLRIVQAELIRTLSYFELLAFAYRAVQYDPTNVNAQIQYGLLARNVSDYQGARAAFQAALQVDPGNLEAQRQLASLPTRPTPQVPAPPGEQPSDTPAPLPEPPPPAEQGEPGAEAESKGQAPPVPLDESPPIVPPLPDAPPPALPPDAGA